MKTKARLVKGGRGDGKRGPIGVFNGDCSITTSK